MLDAAVLAFALAAPSLTRRMMDSLPTCMFLRYGYQCPSCGGTRCVKYFFTGRFADAFSMNPYIFCMILYMALLLILLNVQLITERVKPVIRVMTHYITVIVLVSAFAAFGILRNFF